MMIRALMTGALAGAALSASASAQDHDHDQPFTTYKVMFDRLEARFPDGGGDAGWLWDAQAWWGGDLNKLWIESEGEGADGDVADADLQILYSRAVSSYFDVQAGVRRDFEPDGKTYAVLGLQGLAPYWFEVDLHGYVSDDGDVSADLEAEYDLLLTQRLVLQPRAELSVSASDVDDRAIASGLTNFEAGLRLRYEIRREFAPYVGVSWGKRLGGTADLVRAAGGEDEETALVIGVRGWFEVEVSFVMPVIEPNWHPVVVHFVIALLSAASFFYAVAVFGPAARRDGARAAADWTFALGMLALAVGVAAGFYAYYTVAHDADSHRAMTAHRNVALAAAAAFAALAVWRWITRARAPNAVFSVVSLAAAALVLAAGYKGGEVVFAHGVGVKRMPDASAGDGHDHDHGDGGHAEEIPEAVASEDHNHVDAAEHDREITPAADTAHVHDDGAVHDHGAPADVPDSPEAVVAAFHAALESGDIDAARALMAADVVILEGGGSERSFDEYASHHLSSDMAFVAATESATTRRDAYGGVDVAWVVTEGRTSGEFNGRAIDRASLETMILRRTDGVWRIVHVHWS